jgi:Ras GTPase-activating-like protein IQGAP2/3
VADVEPLEGYFQAHAMLESTLEAKPVSITRNEIYGMLSILMRHVPIIVSTQLSGLARVMKLIVQTNNKPEDPIAPVLEELEGPPIDFDKSKTLVMLRLANRFTDDKRTSLLFPRDGERS